MLMPTLIIINIPTITYGENSGRMKGIILRSPELKISATIKTKGNTPINKAKKNIIKR